MEVLLCSKQGLDICQNLVVFFGYEELWHAGLIVGWLAGRAATLLTLSCSMCSARTCSVGGSNSVAASPVKAGDVAVLLQRSWWAKLQEVGEAEQERYLAALETLVCFE